MPFNLCGEARSTTSNQLQADRPKCVEEAIYIFRLGRLKSFDIRGRGRGRRAHTNQTNETTLVKRDWWWWHRNIPRLHTHTLYSNTCLRVGCRPSPSITYIYINICELWVQAFVLVCKRLMEIYGWWILKFTGTFLNGFEQSNIYVTRYFTL